MRRLYYLGAFPPGYGGVTVKNQNLFTALHEKLEIEKIDFNAIKRKDVKTALRFLRIFFDRKNTFVIGVSGRKTRRRFCKLLYHCNRPSMNRSIIFLMGGTVSKDIAADPEYQRYMQEYKRVYVEINGMRRELEAVGLNNVGIYPNCRFRPEQSLRVEVDADDPNGDRRLKCVFFSLIQPQKGVELLIEVAKVTPEITYSFYGPIDEDYREDFLTAVSGLENTEYHGVFQGTTRAACQELSKYDVLLFPTLWDIEGVPGILVEAKMAGITCIVSNRSYNAEIVEDGVSGIVLSENTAEEVTDAIRTLDGDRAVLAKLAAGAKQSAERYYIDNYIPAICADILNVGTENGGVSYEIICILIPEYLLCDPPYWAVNSFLRTSDLMRREQA